MTIRGCIGIPPVENYDFCASAIQKYGETTSCDTCDWRLCNNDSFAFKITYSVLIIVLLNLAVFLANIEMSETCTHFE